MRVQPGNVDWNGLVNQLGGTEVLEWQGWLVTDIIVAQPSLLQIHCAGVTTAYLQHSACRQQMRNGTVSDSSSASLPCGLQPFVGDQYHRGFPSAVFGASRGVWELFVHVRAKVQAAFACEIRRLGAAAVGTKAHMEAEAPLLQRAPLHPLPLPTLQRLMVETVAAAAPPPAAIAEALQVQQPLHVPDLVEGALLTPWLAVPVTNAGPLPLYFLQPLPGHCQDVAATPYNGHRGATTGAADRQCLTWLPHSHDETTDGIAASASVLLPGQSVLFPLRLAVADAGCEPQSCQAKTQTIWTMNCATVPSLSLRLQALAVASDGAAAVVTAGISIRLRCRSAREAFLYTFVDHDGSIQTAAAVATYAAAPLPPVPVLLSLHGTGVTPENQAAAYKVMTLRSHPTALFNAFLRVNFTRSCSRYHGR